MGLFGLIKYVGRVFFLDLEPSSKVDLGRSKADDNTEVSFVCSIANF